MSKSKRKAFPIPAINNEKEALMIFLKLNRESDADYEKVEQLPHFKNTAGFNVSVFVYNNAIFHVAHSVSAIQGVCTIAFNSSRWIISPKPMVGFSHSLLKQAV